MITPDEALMLYRANQIVPRNEYNVATVEGLRLRGLAFMCGDGTVIVTPAGEKALEEFRSIWAVKRRLKA